MHTGKLSHKFIFIVVIPLLLGMLALLSLALQKNQGNYSDYWNNVAGSGSAELRAREAAAVDSAKFELPVRLYRQELQYECNLTATRMVLDYYQVGRSQSEILAQLPRDTTPFNAEQNIWGNPHSSFVGDVSGKTRGYGVYWEPLAAYLEGQLGRTVEARTGWTRAQVLAEVQAGRPVVLWWQNGVDTPTDTSWQTSSGETVKTVNGMHSEVLIGWYGEIDSPQYLLVNDPWRGRRLLTVAEFDALWKILDNAALVVR